MLWLCCRPAAALQIPPLAWELPYFTGGAVKRWKGKERRGKERRGEERKEERERKKEKKRKKRNYY